MATKIKPVIGDKGWFVEWCHELVFDEFGDLDHDRCKNTCHYVFYPVEFVPYDDDDIAQYPRVGYWEVTAEPEYYGGGEVSR